MEFLYMLESIRTPIITSILSAITYLGDGVAFIVLAVILFWTGKRKDAYLMICTGVLSSVTSQVMKLAFHVSRPWVLDKNFTPVESAIEGAEGFSFPSGHSTNAVVLYGSLGITQKKYKWVKWVCLALIVIIAFSRMYLGVHTPKDVIVGLALGALFMVVFYAIFKNAEKHPGIVTITLALCVVLSLGSALFIEFYSWSDQISAENVQAGLKNCYLMVGCSVSVLIGNLIERKKVYFDSYAPFWFQVLKCAVGLAIMLGIRAGLKPVMTLVFGDAAFADAVRYFIVSFFAICIWPLTFRWFAAGCPFKKTQK